MSAHQAYFLCIITAFNLFSFPFCLGTLAFFPGHQEQKRIDGTTREVKKVRKARNRRQEWNMMAYDKELRPDNRLSQSVYHGASSEGSLSPDTRCVCTCVVAKPLGPTAFYYTLEMHQELWCLYGQQCASNFP